MAGWLIAYKSDWKVKVKVKVNWKFQLVVDFLTHKCTRVLEYCTRLE